MSNVNPTFCILKTFPPVQFLFPVSSTFLDNIIPSIFLCVSMSFFRLSRSSSILAIFIHSAELISFTTWGSQSWSHFSSWDSAQVVQRGRIYLFILQSEIHSVYKDQRVPVSFKSWMILFPSSLLYSVLLLFFSTLVLHNHQKTSISITWATYSFFFSFWPFI